MPNGLLRDFSTECDPDYAICLGVALERPECCLIPNLCGLAGSALQFGLCCPIATISMFLDFSTNRYFEPLDRFTNGTLRRATFGWVGLNMRQNQNNQTSQTTESIYFPLELQAQLVMATPAVRRPINFVDEFLGAPNIFIDDPVTKSFLYEDREIAQEAVNNGFGTVNSHNKIFLEFVKKSFDFNQKNQTDKSELNSLKSKIENDLRGLIEGSNDDVLKKRIEENTKIFFECCEDYGKIVSENEYKSFLDLIVEKRLIDSHQTLIGVILFPVPQRVVLQTSQEAIQISNPNLVNIEGRAVN